jgi:hypothetical protein
MLGLREFSSYPVDIHYPLRGVCVSQNLCVELAQSLCFALCQLVPSDKGIHFVGKTVVSLLVTLSVLQLRR